MLDKTKNIAISIFRYVIIFGIAFYIIYPLIQKTLFMFMNKSDIYDITVVELFIKLVHAFKNVVYMFLFGGIILLVLAFIIIGKFFR